MEWRTDKPTMPGLYLVTVKLYMDEKPVDVTTHFSNWHQGEWLGVKDEDVIAWAKLPEPYREEQIAMF